MNEALTALKTVYHSLPNTTKLPLIDSPFSSTTENLFLISNKKLKKDDFICKICSRTFILKDMRTHVAKHILSNHCVKNCCGFCGLSCNCILELRKSSAYGLNANFKPFSNCSLFYSFSLAPVEKVGSFCSNRPIVCKICRNVFWSYNMQDHYEDHHNGVTFPQEYVIPPKEIKNIKASSRF